MRGGGYTMNNTNETKMDMKQTKQNSTPNIRWTLVGYDLIVYALVVVILLVLYTYYKSILLYAGFCVVLFWFMRLYKSIWRFASYTELLRVSVATAISGIVYILVLTVFVQRMPVSYYLIGIAYDIQLELKKKYPEMKLDTIIGSVRDSRKMFQVFEKYRPIPFDIDEFLEQLDGLLEAAYKNKGDMKERVQKVVSTYHPA